MNETLVHRGPDDCGIWIDESAGIALGHRRLSVIDLSPAGHQPMVSGDGRYVIVYNGEIYNHRELCRCLRRLGHAFRGASDTEVLLTAIQHWGMRVALGRCNGMFAFALWDRRERRLELGCDRVGEKPLYYGRCGDSIIFGSELGALMSDPALPRQVNRDALALYIRHGYVPAPHAMLEQVYKLEPATTIRFDAENKLDNAYASPYWSAREVAERGAAAAAGSRLTDTEGIEQTESLLADAVKLRMVADVPLGAFLSGGIDSSTIVALMQQQSSRPIKTFSVGFKETGFDEAPFALKIARHLGTDHTQVYVGADESRAVVPRLAEIYSEPFADSSQIPSFLISAVARQNVTVSLSGDAGDELFAGYHRYVLAEKLWRSAGWLPAAVREFVSRLMTGVPPAIWDLLWSPIRALLAQRAELGLVGDRVHKLAGILAADSRESMYRRLVSQCNSPEAVVLSAKEPATWLSDKRKWAELDDFTQQMMYLDTVSYLPGDILTKVDRASMAVSLESRIPFLDHRLIELAWTLPMEMKIRDGKGKWLLRAILARHVPEHLFQRPKMGFGVPIGHWLRGPLREWAESLLEARRLRDEGFFDVECVTKTWQEHLSGRRNWQHLLWNFIMFQSWQDRWLRLG